MKKWLWIGLVGCVGCTAPFTGPTVEFNLDLRAEQTAGTFDPAIHQVGVRGAVSPLSWQQTIHAKDSDGDGIYTVEITFPEMTEDSLYVPYKIKIDRPNEGNTGWEEGANRTFLLKPAGATITRAFNTGTPPIPSTMTGHIEIHEGFASAFLGPRDVYVYLPPDYQSQPQRRYPVLYMHDGQNIFDARSVGMEWRVDETAETLIAADEIEPIIVVGVSNTSQRTTEYTPIPDPNRPEWGGGQGDLYGRLLVEEVMPFINATYRTKPERAHTGLGGSSLGGLITMYLGLQYADRFGKLLVVSPSVWWANEAILDNVRAFDGSPDQKIWVDMGTAEGSDMVAGSRKLYALLQEKGWHAGENLIYREDKGARHDERAWAERIPDMLRFIFGTQIP